jgi:hypothetical protein
MNLAEAQIKSLSRDAFKDARDLVKLDLRGNQLSALEPGTFMGLGKLEDL